MAFKVTFDDGSTHAYPGAPTPETIAAHVVCDVLGNPWGTPIPPHKQAAFTDADARIERKLKDQPSKYPRRPLIGARS